MARPKRRSSSSSSARCRPAADFSLPPDWSKRSIIWKTCASREAEIEWLRSTGRFGKNLLDYLADFRFTGDVDAMPEGTVFFADEPILRVTAPIAAGAIRRNRA